MYSSADVSSSEDLTSSSSSVGAVPEACLPPLVLLRARDVAARVVGPAQCKKELVNGNGYNLQYIL